MSSENIDTYIDEIINSGDSGSKTLASYAAMTWKNNKYVDVVRSGTNGIIVLRAPSDADYLVFPVTANSAINDPEEYVHSMIDSAENICLSNDAQFVGFADTIDVNHHDNKLITTIGETLVSRLSKNGVAILNGEYAILGDRLRDYNISGMGIALIKKSRLPKFFREAKIKMPRGHTASIITNDERPLYTNSDGVGTKTEFYVRASDKTIFWYAPDIRHLSLLDSLAMKLDDTVKIGAEAKVVIDVMDYRGAINKNKMMFYAKKYGYKLGIDYILTAENVHERILGYGDDEFNISGSMASLIDEKFLKTPLTPKTGDKIIAIRAKGPRSNGITAKRQAMIKKYGENWHNLSEGQEYLKFLAQPSIIFYPLFRELINKEIASSVYHMSGGAFNGKLARPLAKNNLYVELYDLFEPDWRELELAKYSGTINDAYAKWPMGNEGFITTKNPEQAIKIINHYGYEAHEVGILENAVTKTGVFLKDKKIYFSGI